jgi:cytochrome c553
MTKLTLSELILGALAIGCFAVAQPVPAVAQSLDELATVCAGCHGENGVPIEKNIPVIWGQNRAYMLNQLLDFKNGHRKDDQMGPIVESLSKTDMEALAKHFSQQKWPEIEQPAPSNEVKAQARSILNPMNCRGCHQEHYQGDTVRPRLAGQQEEYLAKTMTDFHSGTRTTYPGMVALMKAVNEPDIKPLATYLASLKIPAKK